MAEKKVNIPLSVTRAGYSAVAEFCKKHPGTYEYAPEQAPVVAPVLKSLKVEKEASPSQNVTKS